MAGWRESLLRLHSLLIIEELYIPRIHSLLVLPGVCTLTSRLSAMKRARWGHLNTQQFVLLSESPCLVEQGLHLSLTLTLASFHTLEPVEVVFATHGRPMADDQLLEGVDIFIRFPQIVPNLILGQLRMDSSLRCGSERFRSGAEIWAFYFLAQKCPDRLSGHTLRSPSQTLGMNRNPKRERERERVRELTVSPICSISVRFL